MKRYQLYAFADLSIIRNKVLLLKQWFRFKWNEKLKGAYEWNTKTPIGGGTYFCSR